MRSPIERAQNAGATAVFVFTEAASSAHVCIVYPGGFLKLARMTSKDSAIPEATKLAKSLGIPYIGLCDNPGEKYKIKG